MSSTREIAGKTAVAFICLAACSSSPDTRSGAQTGGSSGSNTGGSRGTGGSGMATGGSGVATGGGTGAGMGGAMGTEGGSSDPPATLPFAVDQYYSASGFMGDGATAGLIVLDNTCRDPRPAGAVGQCYRFTYHHVTWGGVYWQYPANNWGATPGKRIAQGATRIRFYAAGAAGGETVSFIVFGVGVGDTMATYRDLATVTVTQTLTTTMTPYEINITGQTYDAVIGGFGWVAPPAGVTLQTDGAPLVFYVDGIEWE